MKRKKALTITIISIVSLALITTFIVMNLESNKKNNKFVKSMKVNTSSSAKISSATVTPLATTLTPTASLTNSPTLTPSPTLTNTPKVNPIGTSTQKAAANQSGGLKIAYITVDDGPSIEITPSILDTLKAYSAKATFFVNYRSDLGSIYQRIINEGHSLGNHTYNHNFANLYTDDISYFKEDVQKMHNYLLTSFGYTTKVFRFPGGSGGRNANNINPRTAYVNSIGYKYYDWNISTCDTDPNLTIANYGSEENIVAKLVSNIVDKTNNRSQLIILMHDSKNKVYTAKALPGIIQGLRNQGYAFRSL